jgi:hypothetical protein
MTAKSAKWHGLFLRPRSAVHNGSRSRLHRTAPRGPLVATSGSGDAISGPQIRKCAVVPRPPLCDPRHSDRLFNAAIFCAVVRIPGNTWLTKLGDEASDGLIFFASPRLKHPSRFDHSPWPGQFARVRSDARDADVCRWPRRSFFKSLQKSSQNMWRHDIRGLSGHVRTACKKF